jgi:hypothetical protein
MPLTRLLDRIANAGSWLVLPLVLPLALLLFLQWPLRDVVGAGSRPANDMAQWLFALYVAVALRHAVLQLGFLLPSFGYALVMSRSLLPAAPSPASDEAERLMQEAIRGEQQHERAAPPEPH